LSLSVSKWSLIWPVVLLAAVPLAVGYFVYPNHLPPGFGVFPPQLVAAAPRFNATYFAIIAVLASMVVLLYAVPKIFGIKGGQVKPKVARSAHYPLWFYIGAITMVISWYLMWARPAALSNIVPYVFSPLWWGFILLLDGIVFKRNNGDSFISLRPKLMVVCALVSLVGWLFFEFFDYFAGMSWYYPNMQVISHKMTVLVFLVAYTTVWPAVFVWYNFLTTFPGLVARYENGPKWSFLAVSKKTGVLFMLLGYLMMAGLVKWPLLLYWAVWIGPTFVFIGILLMCNISTPMTDNLIRGNWAPALLVMLACILNGFIWEFWNHGSAVPLDPVMNPNFWKYNIPYVNVIHVFSEMPLLGYFGYMPFGVLVWQFYIWAGKLFGFSAEINVIK